MILGGDLNCGPQDIELVMLRSLLPQLQDSWNKVHPDEPGCTSNYDLPGEQSHACKLLQAAATKTILWQKNEYLQSAQELRSVICRSGCAEPRKKLLLCPGHAEKDPPKRIDFLLSSLMPVSAELVMDLSATSMRLSDHLGLKSVFACNAAPSRKR